MFQTNSSSKPSVDEEVGRASASYHVHLALITVRVDDPVVPGAVMIMLQPITDSMRR